MAYTNCDDTMQRGYTPRQSGSGLHRRLQKRRMPLNSILWRDSCIFREIFHMENTE